MNAALVFAAILIACTATLLLIVARSLDKRELDLRKKELNLRKKNK